MLQILYIYFMQKLLSFFILGLAVINGKAQTVISDSETEQPISYASISFRNGNGIVADDQGLFVFTKKLYPDIDSLFISALGYEDLNISAIELKPNIFLKQKVSELDEVIINATVETFLNKKFKTESIKPYLDDDYYSCWLPTIESEIAVFFPNRNEKKKRLASIKFPIALESKDWKKRKRSNKDKKAFSTLFKVNIYDGKNGKPYLNLNKKPIVFRATEKDGDYSKLDVASQNIIMPDTGIFISIQVLGYTDKDGKLLPYKKYKELKGPEGIVKIPTNFRPLLPFTAEIENHRTFIKRVFINNNEWKIFKKGNGFQSSLLQNGLTNYGIGIDLHIFKE